VLSEYIDCGTAVSPHRLYAREIVPRGTISRSGCLSRAERSRYFKLFHVEQFELTNSAIASYEMYRPSPVFIRVCEVLEGWAGVRGLRVGTTRRVSAITIVTHGTIVLTDTCVGEDLRRIAVTQVPENCTLLAAWGGRGEGYPPWWCGPCRCGTTRICTNFDCAPMVGVVLQNGGEFWKHWRG
jgi:hypothetical protein